MKTLLAPALALCLAFAAPQVHADAVQTGHGLSAFGELKYPADFEHFDYVNPDAPKGGELKTVSTMAIGTFDSLNGYIIKGDPAAGVAGSENLIFDSLMVRAMDEPDAVYGLVAESAELLPGKWVTFNMREEAVFSDGTPLTAEDAKTTFDLLKEKGHPAYRLALDDIDNAEVLGPHRIRYNFVEGAPSRLLPMLVATLPIFSKAYYDEHDFNESSLDPPLGSGPYIPGNIVRNRSISFERREDYWAADLPVNRGRWNFDTIRFEYFKLQPFADQLPASVFTEVYEPPVTDGSGRARRNIRAAQKLLDDAGWKLVEGKRVNDAGEPLTIEFLADSATFARITNPYIQNLERLGIDATLRQVDRPQYQRRVEEYDYDIIVARLSFTMTPGPSLPTTFGSEAADQPATSNFAGIKDPVVDALLETVQAANTRDELYAALRATDRVMRSNFYWVPQWSKASHTLAYADKFGFPETKPLLSRGVYDTWWIDPAKAEAD